MEYQDVVDLKQVRDGYIKELDAVTERIFDRLQEDFIEFTSEWVENLNRKYHNHHFVLCDSMGQISLDVYSLTGVNKGRRLFYFIEGCERFFHGEAFMNKDIQLLDKIQDSLNYIACNSKEVSMSGFIQTANTPTIEDVLTDNTGRGKT